MSRGSAILLFLATFIGNTIQAQEYIVSTIAGTGAQTFSGDGGPATSAGLNSCRDVVVDRAGNILIGDIANNRIRKVSPTGIITTVAGGGSNGLGDGGPATSAQIETRGVALDGAGNLFIAQLGRVRKVSSTGVITTVAGGGSMDPGDGGPAVNAKLGYAQAVAVDSAGNLFITDGNAIRKVSAAGIITTVAGSTAEGSSGYAGDGGPASRAKLSQPDGVAVDRAGNLFIADTENYRVRKVSTDGIITTVADLGQISTGRPHRLSVDGNGNLFVSDDVQIRKLASNGIVTTVARWNDTAYAGDGGLAGLTNIVRPLGVAVDGAGNLYVTSGNTVRMLRLVKPLDVKTGYWDVTEHYPMPAAVKEAFDQQLAGYQKLPPEYRDAAIANLKEAQAKAGKGIDSKRGICVLSEHPLQSLLFDGEVSSSFSPSGRCTMQTDLSAQKVTVHAVCVDGFEESQVVERIDSSHFKGSLDSHATDPRFQGRNVTFSAAWARSSCVPVAQ